MTDALQSKIKRRIRLRDKVCVVCGFDAYVLLHTHHIKSRKMGGNHDESNLVCLCPNCHAAVHKLNEEKPVEVIGHFVSVLSNQYSPEQIIKLHSLCN